MENPAADSNLGISIYSEFNSTSSKRAITRDIKVNAYKTKDSIYEYLLSSSDIQKLSKFSKLTDTRCLCSSMLNQINYRYSVTNTTITGLVVDIYLQDMEGDCDEEEYINVDYSYAFDIKDFVSRSN